MYQYPYGDSQQLNLDWIINKIKELDDVIGEHSADVDLEEVATDLISPEYASTNDYNVNDIVYHDGKLYKCNTAIPSPGESWDPTHWDEILLADLASDLVNHAETDKYHNVTIVSTTEDLDSYTDSGFYYFSVTQTNIPAGSNGYLLVIHGEGDRAKQIWFRQGTIGNNDTETYVRTTNGSIWSNWMKLSTASDLSALDSKIDANQLINMKWIRDLKNNEDLDGLYINGWYTTGNNHTYINSPIPNDNSGQRLVVVMAYNNEVSNTYRHMFYANRSYGIYGHRVYASGRWSSWNVYGSKFLTESFTLNAQTNTLDPTSGDSLRIGSYNLAHYNFDTETYINNKQIVAFRKMLADMKFDFLLTQEDRQYIDANDTKASNSYLYYPLLTKHLINGSRSNIIRTCKTSVKDGRLVFNDVPLDSTSRNIAYATYTIGSNTLLILDTHCIWKDADPDDPESATSIAARLQNYQNLFDWADGITDLRKFNDGTLVHVPTHTHTIICMDANCITDTDKTNLQSVATAHGYTMGNGDRFGWFKTCIDRYGMYALDQIIVSNNCLIKNIDAMVGLYPTLHSDHVPVVADILLT